MFSILGFICVGDKTSCGGTVISGSVVDTDSSVRPIARIGDLISCRHKCTIISGDQTMIVAGQPVAMHGSLTTKQCVCISNQNNNKTGIGQTVQQQSTIPVSADSGIAFTPEMQAVEVEQHWIEFSLKNKEGRPFAHENYLVFDPKGQEYRGSLDENGYARIESVAAGVCKVAFPNLGYTSSIESCQK